MATLGIIGGSGLDDPQFLTDARDESIATPYGETSASFRCGKIGNTDVVILGRHGRQHTIPPTFINNRANIWALKELGCEGVIATAACGSLREEMDRGHMVVVDQFIDMTKSRATTFHESFEPGIENAHHAPMADPFDEKLRQRILKTAGDLDLHVHDGGTILTIEGNRFSTRAESRMFRQWGADLVNMTVAPEVILANEIGLPYAAIAVVTDFDSWKTDEPPLVVEDLIKVFIANVDKLTRLLVGTLG